jgi:hypothetical protein
MFVVAFLAVVAEAPHATSGIAGIAKLTSCALTVGEVERVAPVSGTATCDRAMVVGGMDSLDGLGLQLR